MINEDIRAVISLAAVMVSIVAMLVTILISRNSLRLSRRLWEESNRPIITAYVAERGMGSMASTFDLVVCNSGSRPAARVSLHALDSDIERILKPGVSSKLADETRRCFRPEAEIPILKNGEQLATAFGLYAGEDGKAWLNYGEEIEIEVRYHDIEGRRFQNKQPLKIYARSGFAGGSWSP